MIVDLKWAVYLHITPDIAFYIAYNKWQSGFHHNLIMHEMARYFYLTNRLLDKEV